MDNLTNYPSAERMKIRIMGIEEKRCGIAFAVFNLRTQDTAGIIMVIRITIAGAYHAIALLPARHSGDVFVCVFLCFPI